VGGRSVGGKIEMKRVCLYCNHSAHTHPKNV
jgi:hypothetical protein